MNKNQINDYIGKLKGPKVVRIKSVCGNFDAPKKLTYKNAKGSYVVDAEVIFEKHSDFYAFEPSITKANIPDLIAKWILFAMTARQNSGSFYLVVDESNASKVQTIINDKMLSVNLLTI